jgi:hypothetical protein
MPDSSTPVSAIIVMFTPAKWARIARAATRTSDTGISKRATPLMNGGIAWTAKAIAR